MNGRCLMYDLHRLRLLRELSHRGTLAAVAEALGYTPSAVSHQLSLLERETGVELLEPVGRGVRLTPVASALVARTETVMRELEQAEADVAASSHEVAGEVRIATFQTAAKTVVLDAAAELRRAHPLLSVTFSHLSAEKALPALIAREFDLVLSEAYPGQPTVPHPGVEATRLLIDPLLLLTPAEEGTENLAELADADWVMETKGTPARHWAMATCRAVGFEPRVKYETCDLNLHTEIVARGLAAAFVPQLGSEKLPTVHAVPTGHSRIISMSIRTGAASSPALGAVRSAITSAVNRAL